MRLPESLSGLPGPASHVWEWQLLARCRGTELSIFFSPEGERLQLRRERENRAKQICNGCPVSAKCRAHALRVPEHYGTWGGLTQAERARLLA